MSGDTQQTTNPYHARRDDPDLTDEAWIEGERAFEQGIAEGERRATERIVAWLDECAEEEAAETSAFSEVLADNLRVAASLLQRGDHLTTTEDEA